MVTDKAMLRILMTGLVSVGLGTAVPSRGTMKAVPPASRSDAAQEQQNLAFVLKFSEIAFNRHDFDAAAAMVTEDYIQHNPRVPDGRAGFIQFLKASAAARPNFKSTILRSAASGDLVWTHVKVSDGSGKGDMVLVNIFRVTNGRITEHWDVVQPVPDSSANGHTMF